MKPETRIKKEIRTLELDLQDRINAEQKGWKIYEGEPIQSQIFMLQREIDILKFKLRKMENGSAEPIEITDAPIYEELKIYKDLYSFGYRVYRSVIVINKIVELEKKVAELKSF